MGGTTRNKVAKVLSGALTGYSGSPIEVETDLKAGLPSLQIVGMGNKAIDEARQRVQSAIRNSLLEFPAQKITVNLAPAELPKDGTHLDLPIALSILVASGQLRQAEVNNILFAGELALDGSIRPIRGAVLLAELAQSLGDRRIYVPILNASQARLVPCVEVRGVRTLLELFKDLRGLEKLDPLDISRIEASPPAVSQAGTSPGATIDSIIGHEQAKRALVIAAAGRHNLLLSGAPGAGKTLLAKTLPSLLPPLTGEEITEVTKLHNLANGDESVHTSPPFRAPHHSATLSALIGGGLRPRPGDISLAHKGVLFLDELPEYTRTTLEALRQPLEDRTVHLSRLYGHITYPADILLIATMNPCPCGYLGDPHKACQCSAAQIGAYQRRISGPLLDRIDLRLRISKVQHEQFFDTKSLQEKQHSKVLKLIKSARSMQKSRYKRSEFYNAYASIEQARTLFFVEPKAKTLLDDASKKLALTARSYVRVLRVARTIADLERAAHVQAEHIAEALQFR